MLIYLTDNGIGLKRLLDFNQAHRILLCRCMDNSLLTMVVVVITIINIIVMSRTLSISIRIMQHNELSRALIMITQEEEIIFLRITETIHELFHINSIGTLIY